MAQSIQLGDDIMNIVRRESELQSRSIAGDIETTELTDEEKDVWLDGFVEKMGQPRPDEEAYFARRRRLGLGVGLDAAGNLVREKPPAAHETDDDRAGRAERCRQVHALRDPPRAG